MNQDSPQYIPEEDSIDIKKELRYYAYFWPYFLGLALIGLAFAYIYLRYTPSVYQTNAQLQIKKGDSDPTSFLTEGAEGLLNFDKVNVENDIAIITSNSLLSRVVARLDLQTSVQSVGRIAITLLDNADLPFSIDFEDQAQSSGLELSFYNGQGSLVSEDTSYTWDRGQSFQSEGIDLRVTDSLFDSELKFMITRVSRNKAIERLRSSLVVSAASKQGEVVNIVYKGINIKRNEAIVNTLIEVLKEDQVADKREISEVSINFIEDRLIGLTQNIDTISKNTIAFQTANGLYDPMLQTGNALSNIIKGQEEALTLGIQKEIASALLSNLKTQQTYDLLPANVGVDNESLNTLVASYNEAVSQRKSLLISATEQSPLVVELSAQLRDTREAIITGITRYIDGLEVSLAQYTGLEQRTQSAVASLPAKENTLRGFARNFKIVEELYLFLLQRKEEASISYISALPNVKVLSQAVTQSIPVAPKPNTIYLGAVLLGLVIPFGVLFIAKTLDTKINTRDDLSAGLPNFSIVGEIPFEEDESKLDNPRGTIAEATRVMRSNLAFLLPAEGPVVMASTSSIKGEGKSFVSYNLAHSYAALGKKVLLIGADLRNPQLHNRLGIERSPKGLSTYLSNPSDADINALISIRDKDPVHYLLSGAIPPNPSELLARPSFGALIEALKQQYDLVMIDSAPMMLVSDTAPILPLCDLVVYVSRAQFTDKNVFPFIKDVQKRNNMPPIAMVLNGIIAGPQSYYKYGYKYRYSYKYKYNYGYGYGYGEDKSKA